VPLIERGGLSRVIAHVEGHVRQVSGPEFLRDVPLIEQVRAARSSPASMTNEPSFTRP
jgi:hypothetical protein